MKKILSHTAFLFYIAAIFLNTGCSSMPSKSYETIVSELEIPNGNCTIYGKIHRPVTDEKLPVIIMSHGYNGNHNDFYSDCDMFAKNGYIAYSFDFCGGSVFSRSKGRKTTEMTIFTERDDIIAIYEYFTAQDYVDSSNIILFGASQGGMASTLAAEQLGPEKIKALALYYPAYCIPDNWRATYPNETLIPEVNNFWGMNLGKVFFTSIHDFKLFDSIGSFSNPVLIIHGTNDVIVPLSYSEKAVKIFPNASLITLSGEGHGFSPEQAINSRNYVLKFLKKNTATSN